MKPIIALFLIIFISCQSDYDFEEEERNNRIYLDTITTTLIDSLIVSVTDTIFVQDTTYFKVIDTIHIEKIDTVKVIENIKVYDTTYVTVNEVVKVYDTILTYSPTRIRVKFLYHNDLQQVLAIDTIFLDSEEKILWEANGYLVDKVQFELVK